MSLTNEMINENKQKFLELVNSINRDGFKKEELIKKLESSDFFVAPASTRYHNSFAGGLVDHCLCVYYNLCSLVKSKHLENVISQDSMKIVALFHDISKMNFYKDSVRNKKLYSPLGSKQDELGRFDWVSEKEYVVKPAEERFLYGSHEETAEYILRRYIPLTYEESMAIVNHMGGMGFDSSQHVISDVFQRNKLAVLLFLADTLSAYLDE